MKEPKLEGTSPSFDAVQTRKMHRFLSGVAVSLGLIILVFCLITFLVTREGYVLFGLFDLFFPVWFFILFHPMSEEAYQRNLRRLSRRRPGKRAL